MRIAGGAFRPQDKLGVDLSVEIFFPDTVADLLSQISITLRRLVVTKKDDLYSFEVRDARLENSDFLYLDADPDIVGIRTVSLSSRDDKIETWGTGRLHGGATLGNWRRPATA